MADPGNEILQKAFERYEKLTKHKIDDPDLLRIGTLQDLEAELDKRNVDFTEFRKNKHKLYKALRAAMRPVEALNKCTSGSVSVPFPLCAPIFAAVTQLVDAAKDVSSDYDAIESFVTYLKVRIDSISHWTEWLKAC